jgi:hypothetical protein
MENKEAVAFLKKSSAKNFCSLVPATHPRHAGEGRYPRLSTQNTDDSLQLAMSYPPPANNSPGASPLFYKKATSFLEILNVEPSYR